MNKYLVGNEKDKDKDKWKKRGNALSKIPLSIWAWLVSQHIFFTTFCMRSVSIVMNCWFFIPLCKPEDYMLKTAYCSFCVGLEVARCYLTQKAFVLKSNDKELPGKYRFSFWFFICITVGISTFVFNEQLSKKNDLDKISTPEYIQWQSHIEELKKEKADYVEERKTLRENKAAAIKSDKETNNGVLSGNKDIIAQKDKIINKISKLETTLENARTKNTGGKNANKVNDANNNLKSAQGELVKLNTNNNMVDTASKYDADINKVSSEIDNINAKLEKPFVPTTTTQTTENLFENFWIRLITSLVISIAVELVLNVLTVPKTPSNNNSSNDSNNSTSSNIKQKFTRKVASNGSNSKVDYKNAAVQLADAERLRRLALEEERKRIDLMQKQIDLLQANQTAPVVQAPIVQTIDLRKLYDTTDKKTVKKYVDYICNNAKNEVIPGQNKTAKELKISTYLGFHIFGHLKGAGIIEKASPKLTKLKVDKETAYKLLGL
jgi:hypothetical protein